MSARETLAEMRAIEQAATRTAIPSCPGYSATSDGEIWSETSNWRGMGPRAITPTPGAGGYLKVRVHIDGRRVNRAVHRLVAEAFLGPRPALMQIRHLDGNRLHNAASNLRYGTAAENAADREAHGTTARAERNGQAKRFDSELVRRAIWLHLGGLTCRQIGEHLSLDPQTVSLLLKENRAAITEALGVES